ncbi:MAG: hypothetical protein HYS21_01150 [Deltaproteobacteria bacterium]|nr:hypothetical protein [Deltaproteobacteria bacterium]
MKRFLSASAALIAISLFSSAAARAAEENGYFELKKEIQQQRLTVSEIELISPLLKEYKNRSAGSGPVKEIIRESIDNNCRNECLKEAMRVMNRELARGKSPSEAKNTAANSMRANIREKRNRSSTEGRAARNSFEMNRGAADGLRP